MCMQVKPLYIDYARTAKRLDVKRLKAKMWEVITESAEDMKENMVRQESLYHRQQRGGWTGNVHKGLDTVYILSLWGT